METELSSACVSVPFRIVENIQGQKQEIWSITKTEAVTLYLHEQSATAKAGVKTGAKKI